MLDPAHVNWCRNLFASLKEGGRWAVPRSGLIYRRKGNTLELEARAFRYHAAEQESAIDAIASHFEAAGILVE